MLTRIYAAFDSFSAFSSLKICSLKGTFSFPIETWSTRVLHEQLETCERKRNGLKMNIACFISFLYYLLLYCSSHITSLTMIVEDLWEEMSFFQILGKSILAVSPVHYIAYTPYRLYENRTSMFLSVLKRAN